MAAKIINFKKESKEMELKKFVKKTMEKNPDLYSVLSFMKGWNKLKEEEILKKKNFVEEMLRTKPPHPIGFDNYAIAVNNELLRRGLEQIDILEKL